MHDQRVFSHPRGCPKTIVWCDAFDIDAVMRFGLDPLRITRIAESTATTTTTTA